MLSNILSFVKSPIINIIIIDFHYGIYHPYKRCCPPLNDKKLNTYRDQCVEQLKYIDLQYTMKHKLYRYIPLFDNYLIIANYVRLNKYKMFNIIDCHVADKKSFYNALLYHNAGKRMTNRDIKARREYVYNATGYTELISNLDKKTDNVIAECLANIQLKPIPGDIAVKFLRKKRGKLALPYVKNKKNYGTLILRNL